MAASVSPKSDCCFQDRPPLEQFRVLCVACLVLDSLFVLIYGLTTLSGTDASPKTLCYEAHGYTWHTIITGSFMISALAAVAGAVTHSRVVCGGPSTKQMLNSVLRFAHALVCWTLFQAILEAIAYREEPAECTTKPSSGAYGQRSDAQSAGSDGAESAEAGAAAEDRTQAIWEVTCTMLWLAWVTGAVAVGVLARRCLTLLPLEGELSASSAAREEDEANGQGSTPQTMGIPIGQLPTGASAITGAAGGAEGEHNPMEGVAMGMPVGGASASGGKGPKVVDD